MTAGAALRLVVAFLSSASLLASQGTPAVPAVADVKTPTVLALTLDISAKAVRLSSSAPSMGRLGPPDVSSRLASIHAGEVMWIEYTLTPSPADKSQTVGGFLVSMSAIVESPRGESGGGIVRVANRVIGVAVPYTRGPATISFSRVQPSRDGPPEKWTRVPMGSAVIPGVTR